MNITPAIGDMNVKRYLQILYTVYYYRNKLDGWADSHQVSSTIGRVELRNGRFGFVNSHYITKVITEYFFSRNIVRRGKEGRSCIWRITRKGIRYLHRKGVITLEEMAQSEMAMPIEIIYEEDEIKERRRLGIKERRQSR